MSHTHSFPLSDHAAVPESPLREEIAFLGEMLGQTIEASEGIDALHLVERLRKLAWHRRKNDPESESELTQLIGSLDHDQLRTVIRAFTIFLDLANIAEDRQRIRTLRERDLKAHPEGRGESVRDATLRLKKSGVSASGMGRLLDALQIELVFTSHPTEAKRRSVRRKLGRLRELLSESDSVLLPAERERNQKLVRTELAKLWQTDFIRPWRPSIMQEVQRGLSITPVLWKVIPKLCRDLRDSMNETFGDRSPHVRSCFQFGTWIGGDRDGHPGVTPEITEQTIVWLRTAVIEFHLKTCSELFESLSLSQRQSDFGVELATAVQAACELWPPLKEEVASIPTMEVCRRWIRTIHWRLRQTQRITFENCQVVGGYRTASELHSDVSTLLAAVSQSAAAELLVDEVHIWLDRIDTFGFHLARLDVRQDARQYVSVINELFKATGVCVSPDDLEESDRAKLLVSTLATKLQFPVNGLSKDTQETIELFRLLHRVIKVFGRHALGGHVISMTRQPSDVLAVLWLWHQAANDSSLAGEGDIAHLPIIPLFETIVDLQGCRRILDAIFKVPEYRAYLRQQEDRQTVMLGYSDSTKDGGYIAACWSLYTAQQGLYAVAEEHGVNLTFFHGRGGALGRGGGPAARSILSLPAGTFHGSLRMTEQGEVLADRYDDHHIAYRHLEQLVWSSLLACGDPARPNQPEWVEVMEKLSEASFRAYRQLVDQQDFVQFFRSATPIAEIEQLPIGSRPSRRRGGDTLTDLRAIPWVFAWTQCRCLIPAWYGLGSAVDEILQDSDSRQLFQKMYHNWPFFRATIDNAELALAKADLDIAKLYAELASSTKTPMHVQRLISAEFHRTRKALLMITDSTKLLESTPWLMESIRVRNRYIDPLNLVQIDLLRRIRDCPKEEEEELRHLTRLTINGLAAGMRTSG